MVVLAIFKIHSVLQDFIIKINGHPDNTLLNVTS